MNDFWQSIGLLAAIVEMFALLAPAISYGARQFVSFRGHRVAFAAFGIVLCLFAGAKHGAPTVPVVEKPVWMTAIATVDTNTWTSATFSISSSGIIHPETPLFIDVALSGQAETNWQTHVSTTWELRPGVVSFAALSHSNPTNYLVRIRCDASPAIVTITDFAALASVTDRFMSCTFTAPTNIVGKTAIVDVQMDTEIRVWVPVYSFQVATNNSVIIRGNFISNGQDRRVRVRVEDVIIMGGDE